MKTISKLITRFLSTAETQRPQSATLRYIASCFAPQHASHLGGDLSLLCVAVLALAGLPACAATPIATPLGSISDSLQAPSRVAAGAAGAIYVLDPAKGQVVTFDAFGRNIVTKQGLAQPISLAVAPSGTIFLGEEQAGSVSVFDSQWNLQHRLGGGEGEFVLPNHIAVDSASGSNTVFVCDGKANEIKAYHDGTLTVRFGSPGPWEGQFNFPAGVFVSAAGEVFVVDQGNDRVQVFTLGGGFLRAFKLGSGGMGLGGVSGRAQGITGDAQGRLYVADSFQGIVKVFTAAGTSLGSIGGFGEAKGQFRSPTGVTIDSFNRLCVASANNSRVDLIGLDHFSHLAVQPARQAVATGSDVAFAAGAGGPGPFTYRWRKDGVPLFDGGNISGVMTETLTLTGAATNDTGAYSFEVTGPAGPVVSPEAALAVLTPPALVTQPTNRTVLPGSDVALTVEATGDALSYQWLRNGADLPDATASTLLLTNVHGDDTARYSVVVNNPVGSVLSASALLTVRQPPYAPTITALSFLPLGRMQFHLDAEPDCPLSILASPDLSNWAPVTNLFYTSGPVEFTDSASAGNRFYRMGWFSW